MTKPPPGRVTRQVKQEAAHTRRSPHPQGVPAHEEEPHHAEEEEHAQTNPQPPMPASTAARTNPADPADALAQSPTPPPNTPKNRNVEAHLHAEHPRISHPQDNPRPMPPTPADLGPPARAPPGGAARPKPPRVNRPTERIGIQTRTGGTMKRTITAAIAALIIGGTIGVMAGPQPIHRDNAKGWATAQGFIAPPDEAAWKKPITREQLAVILMRYHCATTSNAPECTPAPATTTTTPAGAEPAPAPTVSPPPTEEPPPTTTTTSNTWQTPTIDPPPTAATTTTTTTPEPTPTTPPTTTTTTTTTAPPTAHWTPLLQYGYEGNKYHWGISNLPPSPTDLQVNCTLRLKGRRTTPIQLPNGDWTFSYTREANCTVTGTISPTSSGNFPRRQAILRGETVTGIDFTCQPACTVERVAFRPF